MDGRLLAIFNEFARPSQISLIAGNGVAEIKTLVDYFLPKPSIDRASIRMNELLRQRYSVPKSDAASSQGGGGLCPTPVKQSPDPHTKLQNVDNQPNNDIVHDLAFRVTDSLAAQSFNAGSKG